ncbi:alpha/beta hydrolase [Aquibium sp. A9E412]|uniref:alpha/beta hydrolase n=1 Tax=Aquibium sp. A9E412 TaxID=2976767 RepID=UPI0025B109CA|nr:alpha/beta hydrolase [Aquibium sp. A9E412]MDN2564628.1 alpha/beta hydrolase [Aquibium sp. A9E412]
MKIEDYPSQEPLSEVARGYHEGCLARRREEGIDIAYGADPYQRLNLFPAPRPDGRVLAFVHGGGWTNGYKEWMDFMAPAFTRAGVTFASIGYRLAPAFLFPTGPEDVAEGVMHLREIVADHGGDPERLFLGGHSAGGHYAALLATRTSWHRARGIAENPLRGCLPVSGVYDFGPSSALPMRPRFLGPPSDDVDRVASPLEGLERAPPFLIAFGERDFPHLKAQAAKMVQALRERGGTVRQIEFPGLDHFEASYLAGDPDGIWVAEALRFMQDPS